MSSSQRLLSFSVLLLLAASSVAQEEADAFGFSFANPGARSLGFGSAFVALADDATAAFSNPAGLTHLLEPEISVEGRGQGLKAPRTGTVEDVTGLGFVSFALPWKKGSVAVYRNDFANFALGTRFRGNLSEDLVFDVQRLTDFRLVNTGAAGGFRVNERLSVGAGVSYWKGSFESQLVRSVPDE